MAFFGNKRKDFSIQPPRQQVDGTPFFVTDSANIDFTLANLNLTANLTQLLPTSGTYGDATHIPILQIDQFGRITGVTTTTFSAAGILLQTNSVTNPTQTILNLIQGTNMTITDDGLGNITFDATGGSSSGTVTSVSAGTGMNFTTITTSGSVDIDITKVPYLAAGFSTGLLKWDGTAWVFDNSAYLTTAVTSVGLSMPSAFTVSSSPVTTSGTLAVTGAGTTSQYVRGDGSLATYNPGAGGGGASVSYYLNGSVNQGTFGGSTYYEMSKTPVLGGGTTFTRLNSAGNGLIAQFITDAGDPNLLAIPGGNWNLELFFKASSGGGSPSYYVELYKYDTIGLTFTLIATDVLTPEGITNGTVLDAYFTALAVPTTPLALTDRLALRIFVNTSGRNIELHTENGHLCQVITTFTTGLTALNGLTDQVQNFATPGTSGTAPNWNSVSPTHTLNIPLASTASVTAGLISKTEYDTFNGKQDALTATKSVEIVSNNVELDGDETSPTARKFYSTSAAAARGWRAIEKADLPTVIQGATYPYVEKEFTSSNGGSAIIKIPGSNIIFVAYTTTSTVVCYDTLTSEIKSTTSLLQASGLVYVAATMEVWAFSSAASITRFVATTGVSLGATPVLLLTASCRGIYDDSLVTGNVYAYNGTTMNVINHSTYVRLGVAIGAGTQSWELTLVTSGPQAGLLVGCVNIGIFGFNKATNTLAYGPGLPATYSFIKFVPSLGVFIAGSIGSNIVSFITPTTATTLTLGSSVRGIQAPYQFEFDETENRLLIPSTATGAAQVRIAVVELTTLTWIKSVLITAASSNSVTWVASDKANKALYVVGFGLGGSINKVIYA